MIKITRIIKTDSDDWHKVDNDGSMIDNDIDDKHDGDNDEKATYA